MRRVNIDELDAHPDEFDFCTLGDEPFTGAACTVAPDGTVGLEWTFRDGLRWGPQRIWHITGRLAEVYYAVAGMPHGVHRWWRADGRKLSVDLDEFGMTVRSRRWGEQGQVEYNFTLSEAEDWYREQLEQLRQEHAALIEAETIPAEYKHLTDADWNDLPTPDDSPTVPQPRMET